MTSIFFSSCEWNIHQKTKFSKFFIPEFHIMGLTSLLALALTAAFVNGQYGPIKGPQARRTTTPFPPGFQSDNDLYNSEPNSIAPVPSPSYPAKSYSSNPTGPANSWWSDNPAPLNNPGPTGCGPSACGRGPSSGYGNLPVSNQKTPAGAIAQPDNPWLSGLIAQNSQPQAQPQPQPQPTKPRRPSSCGYGGCGSPAPSFQQTVPTVPCTTPGYVCVQKFQCQGGQTYSTGTGVSVI